MATRVVSMMDLFYWRGRRDRRAKINHAYVDGFSGFDRGREQEAWHVSCARKRKGGGSVRFSTFAHAVLFGSPLFALPLGLLPLR